MIFPALCLVLATALPAAQPQVAPPDAAYYFLLGRRLESQDKIP
jgi:hypothetical protein